MKKQKPKVEIESEVKRQRITQKIVYWANATKVQPYLRRYDIPFLVDSILEEFYRITLCCGHMVNDMDEGVDLEIDDYYDGEHSVSNGIYCKVCAADYIKQGFARKSKLEEEKDANRI